MAGDSKGVLGRGGMRPKLNAAHTAARSGASTIIAHGRRPDALLQLARGEASGRLLTPAVGAMTARQRRIPAQIQLPGQLHLDEGPAPRLPAPGRSLVPELGGGVSRAR